MTSPTNRLLILGCGFLGQRVAALWQERMGSVFAVTRSTQRAQDWANRGIHPIVADLMQPDTLDALPMVSQILYCVGYDRTSTYSQHAVYVDGLTHAIRRFPDSVKRLVYVSSSSVYGQDDGSWVDDTSPTVPHSDGGRICLEAENTLRAHWDQATILRMSGLYGPERLLARLEQLKAGVPIGGNPDAWLNLIHGDDAALACFAALTAPHPGPLYLVSDDRPVLRREYFTELSRQVGAPTPRFSGTSSSRHSADGLNKRCRNTKVKSELGLSWKYPDFIAGLQSACPPL